MFRNKKKLILFDLDGVLIDSEKNMKFSWLKVKNKFLIKKSFDEYKKYLGMSFLDILNSLKIINNKKDIETYYKSISKLNINLIKPFPDVVNTLSKLNKSNEIKIGILTSKDSQRTKIIVNKFFSKIKFHCIQSPNKKNRPKPAPDLILKIISDMRIDPSECCYIGDSKYDQEMCNRSNIDFIYASYGYGGSSVKSKYFVKKISDIFKIL